MRALGDLTAYEKFLKSEGREDGTLLIYSRKTNEWITWDSSYRSFAKEYGCVCDGNKRSKHSKRLVEKSKINDSDSLHRRSSSETSSIINFA